MFPYPLLLIPQRLYRLQAGGAVGRIQPEEQTHRGGEQRRHQDRVEADGRIDLGVVGSRDLPHRKRDCPAQGDADQSPDHAEHRRFGQELDQDVHAPRPECLSQPDLARALGHRNQHDVHDADPAHQQRYSCDAAQEDGQHPGDRACRIQEILLGEDGEVIRADRRAMARAQDLSDLFGSLWDGLCPGSLHQQHIDPVATRHAAAGVTGQWTEGQ